MRNSSTTLLRTLPDETATLRRLSKVHYGPLAAALILSLIGLMTVASASTVESGSYLPRQILWLLVGLCAVAGVLAFDYHRLVDAAPIFYGAGILTLGLVLLVGHEVKGAKSWLVFGPFSVQPSELVKIATVLVLARYLSSREQPYLSLREILTAGALVGVPVVLIVLERDMGSAAMYMPLFAGMLLVSGIRLRVIIAAVLLGALAAAGVWSFAMKPYQRQRIQSFLSPEADPLGAGYQVRQSKIAVGSGQWTGRGYGQGTQSQLRFLPERQTDFVMAVLAEERGFLGVLAVLVLYGFYVSGAAAIAARSRDRAGILIVAGLVSTTSFHAVYNTGMVVGLLPITGIPLPFLSYGGTFMLLNFLATGLILNVDFCRFVNR